MNRVLGIDPGTNYMGYAVVEKNTNKNFYLQIYGALELKKITDIYDRLRIIYRKVDNLIKQYSPDLLAIEAPFYGKNPQSMLKLGRAQGVAIVAALNNNLQIVEYAPRKIKLAITGNGNASKEQVAAMVIKILNIKEKPSRFDQSDAAAVALCHFFQKQSDYQTKIYSDWKDFINKNKNRIL